ncbi:hypothetical protein DL93DRAFT_450257 [Clavulina sp. PMI_390]|nr:hypothetical protein DL93DRAFT_450257 [Clavulina sp. PMI_390]
MLSIFDSSVLLEVLLNLGAVDIITCRGVSRRWRSTIEATSALKYKVWLYIHQRIDDPNSSAHPTSSSARLTFLLQQERAWASLRPRKIHLINLEDDDALVLPEVSVTSMAAVVPVDSNEDFTPESFFRPPFSSFIQLPQAPFEAHMQPSITVPSKGLLSALDEPHTYFSPGDDLVVIPSK